MTCGRRCPCRSFPSRRGWVACLDVFLRSSGVVHRLLPRVVLPRATAPGGTCLAGDGAGPAVALAFLSLGGCSWRSYVCSPRLAALVFGSRPSFKAKGVVVLRVAAAS